MSNNKLQGQTMHVAGVDLEPPCFSDGQLYVAFSRIVWLDKVSLFSLKMDKPVALFMKEF